MHAESPLAAVGGTPLVELEAVRPDGGARVLAEWEGANPTGSTKDRMAIAMERGARAGLFAGTSTGLNVAAAVAVAAERAPDDVVGTAACDTGLKYLDGGPFAE